MENRDAKPLPRERKRGLLRWVFTHRVARLFVPPLILLTLFALLTFPLVKDTYLFSEDDFFVVTPFPTQRGHEDNLILNVKEVNPNNGVATIDVSYVTSNIERGEVRLCHVRRRPAIPHEPTVSSGVSFVKQSSLIYSTRS